VAAGQSLCVGAEAIQQRPVKVQPGGVLAVSGAQITAPMTSDAGAALTICQTTLTGPVTVRKTSGYVLIGADADDNTACAGNTINGPLTVDFNTGGLEASASTGPVQEINNSGSGLLPEDAVPELEANHITGRSDCGNNLPTLHQAANTR